MSQHEAVVVGAGPAGLAAAAELGRRGVRAVVLERTDAVGASWRGRYDRLRLNSSRWTSQLPGARYARGTGTFPPRDEVVRYLEEYAASRALDVRLNTSVERIDREGDSWRLRTSTGDVAARHVIVATGHSHTPFMPSWPGREAFGGRLLHAADYRNPAAFHAADVLVVGSGCSGMEIAYELASGGAARVRLAVRTSPNILVRSPVGPILARLVIKLGTARADKIMRAVQQRTVGDLTPYGLPIPEEGIASRLARLGVAPAIIDKEAVQAIKDRRFDVVAAVERLDSSGVALADGSRIEPDVVIAATGYHTGLKPMVGHLGVLDDHGKPRVRSGEAAPGLRFIGYIPRPGQIGRMGMEAAQAADAITRPNGSPPRGRHRAGLTPSARRALSLPYKNWPQRGVTIQT
jgi:cation diffusion facilitator CzcD-associated flavoprotein CzcO